MNNLRQRLLVVDDEPKLRSLVQSYLSRQGYEVDTVGDGPSMDHYLQQQTVDLVILDLMLPGEDGLSIARRLRLQSDVSIIILSARGEELDRIVGLEMGADDYLAKPFNPRELLARVRSVLRRNGASPEMPGSKTTEYRFGDFCLHVDRHLLTRDGEPVPLTSGEFTLLRTFLENANRVLDRNALLAKTKGYEHAPFDRSIDVCVGRLRRKIESDPSQPRYLKTVRGAGYIFLMWDE